MFDTLRALSSDADRKKLTFFYGIAAVAPYTLVGDPGRLRQILTNLLANALKFTLQGSICVSVDHGLTGLEFRVSDTGIGISPENLERLFEPFTQADTSLTRDHQGTGLGLSIARQLVRSMGGELLVESVPGRGSTFLFNCPTLKATESGEQVLKGKTITLMDNITARRDVTAGLLRRWGADVHIPQPGERGIRGQFLIEASALEDLDLTQLSWKEPAIVIAHGMLEANGLDGSVVVSGPVGAAQLLQAMESKSAGTQAPFGLPSATADPSALRILVVEDQPANRKLISRILERWGHTVLTAANGQEAVNVFQLQTVDVILMDIQMPVMDGYEATGQIRALDGGQRIPIIAVTAHAVKGDIEKCLAAGMNAYVSKPLDRLRLRETIDSFFGTEPRGPSVGAAV